MRVVAENGFVKQRRKLVNGVFAHSPIAVVCFPEVSATYRKRGVSYCVLGVAPPRSMHVTLRIKNDGSHLFAKGL